MAYFTPRQSPKWANWNSKDGGKGEVNGVDISRLANYTFSVFTLPLNNLIALPVPKEAQL